MNQGLLRQSVQGMCAFVICKSLVGVFTVFGTSIDGGMFTRVMASMRIRSTFMGGMIRQGRSLNRPSLLCGGRRRCLGWIWRQPRAVSIVLTKIKSLNVGLSISLCRGLHLWLRLGWGWMRLDKKESIRSSRSLLRALLLLASFKNKKGTRTQLVLNETCTAIFVVVIVVVFVEISIFTS